MRSDPRRYRDETAQGPSGAESPWQRDYGHRIQRFDTEPRGTAQPRNDTRDNAIEPDLRNNDYPRDVGYARDDRFLLDFGEGESPARALDVRGSSRDGRAFQPQPRQHEDHFGSRVRAEPRHPSGLQAASFYGRGPKGYRRTDERIREDVCQRLSDSAEVDASDIEVTVREREVTLEGSVEARQMKRISEEIAYSAPWVEQVHNLIRVRKGVAKDVPARVLGKDLAEPPAANRRTS